MTLVVPTMLSITGFALAQPDVLGTWLWEVTTQDGDAIVEPGETATFTLSLDFSPDVGEKGLTGEVQGLAYVEFDTLGMAGADQGQIVGWEVLNDLDIALGDVTTTDGTSLFGTVASQTIPFNVLPHDPIDILSVEWAPTLYAPLTVDYATATRSFSVWEGDLNGLLALEWPVSEANVTFQVVPSPSPVVLVAWAIGLRVLRHRR